MKNLSRFSSPSLIKKYCLALTLVLIALLVYAFFSGSINKNNYQLAGVYDEHTLKYQLTLTVNQPKEEEIALQADDEALVSMEMFEFFKSDQVEIMPPAESDKGVRLKVKSANRKVKITLPILLQEGQTTKVQLLRSGKVLEQKKISRSDQKKTKQAAFPVPHSELLTNYSPTTSFANTLLPMNTTADTTDKTAVVYNLPELIVAYNDTSISKIVFGADIKLDWKDRKLQEQGQNFIPLTRSLTIDGKGHTLSFNRLILSEEESNSGYYKIQQQMFLFPLGTSGERSFIFDLKNVKLTSALFGYNTLIGCPASRQASKYWTVKLSNITQQSLDFYIAVVLVFLPQGNVEICGKLTIKTRNNFFIDPWEPKREELNGQLQTRVEGVITGAKILITDKAEVNITSDYGAIHLLPKDTNIAASLIINKGSKVEIKSNAHNILVNDEDTMNEAIFEIADPGTIVNCLNRIEIYGTRNEDKASRTEILRGAQLEVGTVTNDLFSVRDATLLLHQVSGGIFNVDDGAKVLLKTNRNLTDFSGLLRLRLVGEQQLTISNGAEVSAILESLSGKVAAIRASGRDNRIVIKSGGKLTVKNQQTQDEDEIATDGGDLNGRQGIQFALDSGGTSAIKVVDAESMLDVDAQEGPALEAVSGSLSLEIGKETSVSLKGKTASADCGAVQSQEAMNVTIDQPLFYDFNNSRTNGGQALATGANQNQTFVSKRVGLAVWEKRSGVDVNGNPDNLWNSLDYALTGPNFNTIASTDVPNEFNKRTFKGGGAYTRLSGNNSRPVIESLNIPTNADKHVYGQVVIPYELSGSARDAFDQEVWVQLQLLDSKGQEKARQWVHTQGKDSELPGVSVYGAPARGGIFDWELADFLQTGETIKVLQALRGDHLDLDNEKNIFSLPEDIKVKTVTVQDVTPPSSLKVETQAATDTIKQIKGTIDLFDTRDQRLQEEVYIFVKTARGYLTHSDGNNFVKVTAASESQTAGSTIKNWAFDLPAYLDIAADQSVEIFAKDAVTGEPIFSGAAPATLTSEPNNKLGNLSPSVVNGEANREYHDAVGAARFAPSVLLSLKSTIPATPTIRLEIPQSFDRDQNGKPMISRGNQFDYRVTITSGDARDSGKDPVKNLEVTLNKSDYLSYYQLEQLTNHAEIAAIENSDTGFKIKLKNDLASGTSITFTVTAKVEVVPELTTIRTVRTVRGESPIEDPFIPGPPDPSHAHLILQNSNSIDIVTGTRATLGEDVYLSLVNQQLRIYYANVEKLAVYIDGTHYQDFTVKKQRVTDSITLEAPVSEIRNHVSVKYKNSETGKEKIAYWNNHWEFME